MLQKLWSVSVRFLFPSSPPRSLCWVVLTLQKRKERKRRKLNSTGTDKSHTHTHTTNMHTHKWIHNMSVCMCVCELRHLWQVARYVFCGNVDYWCNLTLLAICLSTSFWPGQPTANRPCQRLFSNHFRFPAYDDAYSVCTHTDIPTCICVCMYVYTYIHTYVFSLYMAVSRLTDRVNCAACSSNRCAKKPQQQQVPQKRTKSPKEEESSQNARKHTYIHKYR